MFRSQYSRVAVLTFLVSTLPTLVQAKPLHLVPESATTEFIGIGRPALLKVKGQAKEMAAAIDMTDGTVSGEFKVPLKNLDSGIELRDEHMKNKYLAVGQFPEAILKVDSLKVDAIKNSDRKTLPFTGTLTLHGVAKPVTGEAQVEGRETRYAVDAKFNIKLSEYGIDIPRYAGITFADNVDINVRFEADSK